MKTSETLTVAERVISMLQEQRLLYRQLLDLARKQTDLVSGDDPENLLRVLASRQRLIAKLTGINQELDPIRSQWEQISRELNQDQRSQVKDLVSDVQSLLGDILTQDEQDSEALMEHKAVVAGHIRGAQSGKRMNQAYAQPEKQASGSLLDQVYR